MLIYTVLVCAVFLKICIKFGKQAKLFFFFFHLFSPVGGGGGEENKLLGRCRKEMAKRKESWHL